MSGYGINDLSPIIQSYRRGIAERDQIVDDLNQIISHQIDIIAEQTRRLAIRKDIITKLELQINALNFKITGYIDLIIKQRMAGPKVKDHDRNFSQGLRERFMKINEPTPIIVTDNERKLMREVKELKAQNSDLIHLSDNQEAKIRSLQSELITIDLDNEDRRSRIF